MRNTPSQPVDLPERGLPRMPAERDPWRAVNHTRRGQLLIPNELHL